MITGTKIVAATLYGDIYTSTDSGLNWTNRTAGTQLSGFFWPKIVSDSTGTKLVAFVAGGDIYTSTNSGISWVVRADSLRINNNLNWADVVSDSTGTNLIATARSSVVMSNNTDIYISTNSGVSWSKKIGNLSPAGHVISSIVSDSTGTKIVAVVMGGDIYTSNDFGNNWTNQTIGTPLSGLSWANVTSDTTGTYLAAVDGNTYLHNGDIYTSSDSGVSWIKMSINNATPVLLENPTLRGDSTGQHLIVTTRGSLYISNDYGVSWTNQTDGNSPSGGRSLSGLDWYGVASDSTGTKLVAVVSQEDIYTSTDSGVNWINKTIGTPLSGLIWYGIASDSTGTKLVAIPSYGDIYTSTDSGTNWTNKTIGTPLSGLDWRSINASLNYEIIAARALTRNDGSIFYLSSDSGDTWSKNNNVFQFSNNKTKFLKFVSICGSTNMQYLYSCSKTRVGVNTGIYISSNYGNTWSVVPDDGNNNLNGLQTKNWSSISASYDGTFVAAVLSHYRDGGGIYLSSNSGFTWSIVPDDGNNGLSGLQNIIWSSITTSSNGTFIAACSDQGGYRGIYFSSNSGNTWSLVPDNGNNGLSLLQVNGWNSISCSQDGTKIAAVVYDYNEDGNTGIYLSNDSGITWSLVPDDGNNGLSGLQHKNWKSISYNQDGTKIAAVVFDYYEDGNGGGIYLSSDTGITWSLVPDDGNNGLSGLQNRNWSSISYSRDGTKIAATVLGGGIYLSNDSGNTWSLFNDLYTLQVQSQEWYSILINNQGSIAAVSNFGIFATATANTITILINGTYIPIEGTYYSPDLVSSVTVEVTSSDQTFTVSYSGETSLQIGNNTITITVTASNNTVQVFLVSVYVPSTHTNWYTGGNTYQGNTDITTVTIPSTVTSISEDAFSGCTNLTTVTIPNNVTSLGINSFKDCTNLQTITIPSSISSIPNGTFSGCTSLTSVLLPSTLTTIGNNAFAGCASLNSLRPI